MEEGEGGKTRAPQLWLLHSCNGALSHKYFREVNCPSTPPSCAHCCGPDCRERDREEKLTLALPQLWHQLLLLLWKNGKSLTFLHFFHLACWNTSGVFGGSIASLTLRLVISTRQVILFLLSTDTMKRSKPTMFRNYPQMHISNNSL